MPDHRWQPIEPLSEAERAIDLAGSLALYEAWRAARERLREKHPQSLATFTEQLVRRLAVETGILERLYDLDRGTTEALVAGGFAEELVSRTSTDIEPARLIDLLRDQEAAIQLVMDCVAGNRRVTKSVVHELHAVLTRHQDTTMAVDQLGTRIAVPLLKGKYKEQPNNPRRPGGHVHEYCPPVHVESEMEKLLGWLGEYQDDDPVMVASWLHHRLAQIHPYQDGNGRVARALTTLVLLRAELLPLVVDRDLRSEYIGALENADGGALRPLVSLFSRLERAALLQALSVDAEAAISHDRQLTRAVIESLAARFKRKEQTKQKALRRVNQLAALLRSRARNEVERAFAALEQPLQSMGKPTFFLDDGGPERGNSHWYKHDVIKSGRESGKFINFNEAHYFLKASFRVATERLILVVSFHHVGRELSGIMEATAFAKLESHAGADDREASSSVFSSCAPEPFVFTYRTEEEQIAAAFDRWLDTATAVAIKEYGDRL